MIMLYFSLSPPKFIIYHIFYRRKINPIYPTLIFTYSINLEPSTILQLSYILIWGGFPDIQIEALYNKIGFKLPFHLFLRAYKDATSEPFNFLYIDRPKTELRKNFDMKYDFTDMDDEEDESKESSDSE